jgi:5-methylcytosine-specific restriction endonuclease McrA
MPFKKGHKPISPFQTGNKVNLGRVWSLESREKASIAHKGKKLSTEHKNKIRLAMQGKMPKNIEILKNYWRGKVFSEDYRLKLSVAHKGQGLGEKSHFWKGGKKSYWTKTVKERDGKCMSCGNTDKRVLTADHIKSKKMFPELSLDINNGVTLCHNCHAIKTLEDKEYRKWMSDKHWKKNGKKI